MSQLSDLLEAVVASPDDDAPRRVYADALLETGNPLGEFIHVQCDLARGGLTRAEGIQRRLRERELLAAHEATWRSGLHGLASEPRFVRGFIDEVRVDAETWSARGDALFTVAPALRKVMFDGLLESAADFGGPAATEALMLSRFKQAISSPTLQRLRGLGYYTVGYGYRETQFDTYDITSFGLETLKLLLAHDVSRLTALSINANSAEEVWLLAESPLLKSLEQLELQLIPAWGAADPSAVLAALDPSKLQLLAMDNWNEGLSRFPELKELTIVATNKPVAKIPPGLRRLWLRNEKLTEADVVALSACSGLERFELITSGVPGWRALEQLRLSRLRQLWIHCRQLTIEHWRELSRWPMAENLELLQVPEMSVADLTRLRELFGCIVEVRR